MPMLFEAMMNHLQNIEVTLLNQGIDAVDAQLVRRIAEEFVPRTVIAPGGFRWWADALSFDTYNRSRATFTLATIARDCGVGYPRLANVAPTEEEGARACAVIALKRDVALGAVFEYAEQHYRRLAHEIRAVPDAAATVLASADLIAAANGPISYQRSAGAVSVARARAAMPDIECAVCHFTWRPRVAEPRKCPSCQRRLDWSEENVIAQDAE